jgi:hypothetical protein
MPSRTVAFGSTLLSVTLIPPTCCTLNVCSLDRSGASVPVKLSWMVGATGVGAAGVEVHAAVSNAVPSVALRVFFMVILG